MHLLRNLETPEGPALRKRVQPFWIFMNLMYALNFVLAFVPRFSPSCNHLQVYPPSMFWAACLFMTNAIFQFAMQRYKFFLKWDDAGQVPLLEEEDDSDAK